jgi:proliferating cell nuclear antigen
MDIDTDTLSIPDTEYDVCVTMPSAEFARIVRDLSALGESVKIDVSKDGVRFSAEGEAANGNILLKQTENARRSKVAGKQKEKEKKSKVKREEGGEDEDEDEPESEEGESSKKKKKTKVKREEGASDVEMVDGDDDDDEAKPDEDEDEEEDSESNSKKRKKAPSKARISPCR